MDQRLGPREQFHDCHRTAGIAGSEKRMVQADTRRLNGRLRFTWRGLTRIPPRLFLLDTVLGGSYFAACLSW
jgi:hypothetical protein